MKEQSKRSHYQGSGQTDPETEGRCWPVCQVTDTKHYSKKPQTVDPEQELKQTNDNADYIKLTHLMVGLWVLQAHHLQQNREKGTDTPHTAHAMINHNKYTLKVFD